MKEIVKRQQIVVMKGREKPIVKSRNYWYAKRGHLKKLYDDYRNGKISAEVIMGAFDVDRMKPIVSAYNRMFGRIPPKYDPKQMLLPWGFAGFIEQKGGKNEGRSKKSKVTRKQKNNISKKTKQKYT